MAKTKTSTAVKARYNKKAYDSLQLTIPKGQKSTIQEAAQACGESVNGYIKNAILMRMGLSDWPEIPHNEE